MRKNRGRNHRCPIVAAAGFLDTGELAIKTFDKPAITEYLGVKADLQYIKAPGRAGLEDALVGLVRVQVAF